jgi:NDP-mannose synthase
LKAVILAGGKGTRLEPYTTVFPKPLMPLGEKPILETIIKQLKFHGFDEVIMAVGYLAELIKAYFGDGQAFGVRIRYSKEEQPLGTAGPLALVGELNEPFLVMNGDVLTALSYSKLMKFHRAQGGIATIAVTRRVLDVDYGVITADESNSIVDYDEKPQLNYNVSMGIYVLDPGVLKFIPRGKKLDFPDLIKQLLKIGQKISSYASDDYWLDIGRHSDYSKAQSEVKALGDKVFYAGE